MEVFVGRVELGTRLCLLCMNCILGLPGIFLALSAMTATFSHLLIASMTRGCTARDTVTYGQDRFMVYQDVAIGNLGISWSLE